MPHFSKGILMSDLVDLARAAANGEISLSNERGDYGLLEDLADHIEKIEGKNEALASSASFSLTMRDMVAQAFLSGAASCVSQGYEDWLKTPSPADEAHPKEIWANVAVRGDFRPLAGEWSHADVGSDEDACFVRKDVLDAVVHALHGLNDPKHLVAGKKSENPIQDSLAALYSATMRERDEALRREAALKDNTDELRKLRREHNALRQQLLQMQVAGQIKDLARGVQGIGEAELQVAAQLVLAHIEALYGEGMPWADPINISGDWALRVLRSAAEGGTTITDLSDVFIKPVDDQSGTPG